jgi:hypothetical protein
MPTQRGKNTIGFLGLSLLGLTWFTGFTGFTGFSWLLTPVNLLVVLTLFLSIVSLSG